MKVLQVMDSYFTNVLDLLSFSYYFSVEHLSFSHASKQASKQRTNKQDWCNE